MNLERSVKVQESISIAEKFLSESNIKYSIKKYGDIFNSYCVSLESDDCCGLQILGNGKGIGDQSKASALFEAIEHFVFDKFEKENKFNKTPISYYKENADLLNSNYAIKSIVEEGGIEEIETLKLSKYEGKGTIYIPQLLLFPDIKNNSPISDKYLLYSTNNGTAVGTTLDDAILHATLEVIERDSLSLHYIKHFLCNKKYTIEIVDSSQVCSYNKDLLQELEKIMSRVLLINITSDNNIPSVLCIGYHNGYRYPFVGSGSSIFYDYAIERALTEMLQSFHLFGDDILNEDIERERALKKIDKLVECLKLDYGNYNVIMKMLPEYENRFDNSASQIRFINNHLKKSGTEIYYSTIFKQRHLYCVRVVIPKYESFHLIRSGNIIMPSKRGVDYLRSLN